MRRGAGAAGCFLSLWLLAGPSASGAGETSLQAAPPPAEAPASPEAADPVRPPASSPLEALWEKGELALAEGRTEEAQEAFQTALGLDPGNGRTINYLGGVFFARGDWREALARFTQASLVLPDDPKVFNNIATANDKLGNYPEAIENYLAAIDLAPDYPVPYRNLGAIYAYKTRDLELAERYWTTYLRLVPDSPERASILGELERLKRLQ